MKSARRGSRCGQDCSDSAVELSIGTQTISITAAALCGLAAGLLYDLLRQLRRAGGRTLGFLCDSFFCLYCTVSLFLVGMLFCGGRLGFWEPTAFVGIFCLYCFGISPSITPFFGICGRKGAELLKKHVKKVK